MGKMLYDGEWLAARPMMNHRYTEGADPTCEVCGRASCATAWFSIRTRRFRCFRCFLPDGAELTKAALKYEPGPKKYRRGRVREADVVEMGPGGRFHVVKALRPDRRPQHHEEV